MTDYGSEKEEKEKVYVERKRGRGEDSLYILHTGRSKGHQRRLVPGQKV